MRSSRTSLCAKGRHLRCSNQEGQRARRAQSALAPCADQFVGTIATLLDGLIRRPSNSQIAACRCSCRARERSTIIASAAAQRI